MEDKITLILATTNKGKTAEIKEILKSFPVDIKDLQQFGKLPEVEEDGKTFEENAYKKASFYSRILGFPTMADDSGLCVEALDGKPGIYSARYAGDKASDTEKYQKILAEMKNKDNRKAYFKCNISIAVPTGTALTYEGKCNGIIAEKALGSAGFGYDPIFFYPSANKTFGQMTSAEKGKVSHRGLALAEVCNEFDKITIWIKQQMPVFKRIPKLRKVRGMIEKLIKANRSCRRFNQNKPINSDMLKQFVSLAGLSASAGNLQPLKYIISSDAGLNEEIFSTLSWAAYLKDWKGPKEGEKPAAYIIILLDTEISNNKWSAYDCGIASQSILLAAAEKSLGGCMIGAVNKKRLAQILNVKPQLEIMLVIALGEPNEKIVIETVQDNNIKYFRDKKEIHHVPKRDLEDIIVKVFD